MNQELILDYILLTSTVDRDANEYVCNCEKETPLILKIDSLSISSTIFPSMVDNALVLYR